MRRAGVNQAPQRGRLERLGQFVAEALGEALLDERRDAADARYGLALPALTTAAGETSAVEQMASVLAASATAIVFSHSSHLASSSSAID